MKVQLRYTGKILHHINCTSWASPNLKTPNPKCSKIKIKDFFWAEHQYDITSENLPPDFMWQVTVKTQVYWKYYIRLPSSYVYWVYRKQMNFKLRLGFYPQDISLHTCKYSKINTKSETLWSQAFWRRVTRPILQIVAFLLWDHKPLDSRDYILYFYTISSAAD
jgi:hypothetical protein